MHVAMINLHFSALLLVNHFVDIEKKTNSIDIFNCRLNRLEEQKRLKTTKTQLSPNRWKWTISLKKFKRCVFEYMTSTMRLLPSVMMTFWDKWRQAWDL